MTNKEKIKIWAKDNIVYIGSFLIPFFIMTGVCIACKVVPFGDQSLSIIDGLHQYMPFFAEYHEKIRNLDSFFYSWNGGLGHNFLSLWAYYLSSPLNLFLVLLPKTALPLGFSWLLVFKISLTGLTTAAFFIHRSNKKNWKVLLFSTAFALSNYIIGYSWNIMWMDGILMFPLVLIGFDKLMEKEDGRMYAVCLTLAMIGNYYVAFMICIFLVFWFIFYHHENVKAFFTKGVYFAFFSMLSACMSAVVLLPAYMGLMKTASAGAMSLPEHSWFTNLLDLLQTHLIGTKPLKNNNFDGNANLYVGMFAFLMLFLYIFGRRIKMQEKVKRLLFLAILMISFNEKILNFIWHGFHDQYGIPNRFAFLYLFLLVLSGFEAMEKIRSMRFRHVFSAIVCAIGAVLAVSFLADEKASGIILFLSLGTILLYGILLLLYSMRKIDYKKCIYPLAILVAVEIVGTSFFGFLSNGQIDTVKYFADTKAIEELKKAMPEEELVRAELVKAKMLDEATWHNLKSVGMFGSTVNGTTVSAMDHIGFFTGANEYLYKGATPLTNVLLNVKYNILRDGDTNANGFFIVSEEEGIALLENPYETSIGYGISGDLSDWVYTSAYPFRVLNRFVGSAYNMDLLFHEHSIPDPATNDCSIEPTKNNGEYKISYEEVHDDNITFTIPVNENEDIYLHYDGSRVEKAVVKVGDEVRASKKMNAEIFHVGLIEEDTKLTVQFKLKDDDLNTGVVRLSVASFDNELFEEVHQVMMEQAVEVSSYTSDSIEGTISLKEDGLIFFSIPYDTGWKVKLDGEEREVFPVADGFLAVNAEKGDWKIEMNFEPAGWKEGLMVSFAGVCIFLFVLLSYRKTGRKQDDSKPAAIFSEVSAEQEILTDREELSDQEVLPDQKEEK